MHQHYWGLPAAPSVEQAILAAQQLILKGRETPRTGGTFSATPAFHQP